MFGGFGSMTEMIKRTQANLSLKKSNGNYFKHNIQRFSTNDDKPLSPRIIRKLTDRNMMIERINKRRDSQKIKRIFVLMIWIIFICFFIYVYVQSGNFE